MRVIASTMIVFERWLLTLAASLSKQLSATGLDYVCQLVAEVKDETTGSTAVGGAQGGEWWVTTGRPWAASE